MSSIQSRPDLFSDSDPHDNNGLLALLLCHRINADKEVVRFSTCAPPAPDDQLELTASTVQRAYEIPGDITDDEHHFEPALTDAPTDNRALIVIAHLLGYDQERAPDGGLPEFSSRRWAAEDVPTVFAILIKLLLHEDLFVPLEDAFTQMGDAGRCAAIALVSPVCYEESDRADLHEEISRIRAAAVSYCKTQKWMAPDAFGFGSANAFARASASVDDAEFAALVPLLRSAPAGAPRNALLGACVNRLKALKEAGMNTDQPALSTLPGSVQKQIKIKAGLITSGTTTAAMFSTTRGFGHPPPGIGIDPFKSSPAELNKHAVRFGMGGTGDFSAVFTDKPGAQTEGSDTTPTGARQNTDYPMPTRAVAVGQFIVPMDFIAESDDPDLQLAADAKDLVIQLDGSLRPKGRSFVTKRADSVTNLMIGGYRLGQYQQGTGQWSAAAVNDHADYIQYMVKLHTVSGYTWAQVSEIEHEYRKGMHTTKYHVWSDPNTIMTLAFTSGALVTKQRRPAPAASDGGVDDKERTRAKKKKKKTREAAGDTRKQRDNSNGNQKHSKKDGKDLCFNFNRGLDCNVTAGGKCERVHACWVCLSTAHPGHKHA
jgi:hypothetical protein